MVPSGKVKSGRGERIRTSDPSVPNRVLYQAEPRPDTIPYSTSAGVARVSACTISIASWFVQSEWSGVTETQPLRTVS